MKSAMKKKQSGLEKNRGGNGRKIAILDEVIRIVFDEVALHREGNNASDMLPGKKNLWKRKKWTLLENTHTCCQCLRLERRLFCCSQ